MSIRRDRKKKKEEAKLRKEKKRREKRIEASKLKLAERFKEENPHPDAKIIIEPPDQVKMSEVIMDFVRPFLEGAPNRQARENMILVTITAWNLCLLPKKEQKKVLAKFQTEESMNDEGINVIKAMLKAISAYKKEFYPDVNRFILDYEFTESRNDMHLNVVSSMEPPQ